ncbi:membrane fusion protein, multidrug efflux system [Paraburkholderia hospita]|nr:efflux RND transporter periplasmic adaptor subunit [Paraburkholderia hospita]SEH86044.1 membrane fusion protein, multidrug efflux system [Paraburkholderia hospita]
MPALLKNRNFRMLAATAAISPVIPFLAACSDKPAAQPQQTPEVGVVSIKPTGVPVTVELPGRVSAHLVAEVRARVDGIVLKREFAEGSEVKAGQTLYKIDPAPYIASLNSAKATLAKAQATLVSTHAEAERYKVLVAANAISKQDYDNAVASEGQAAADVASGKAAVETAQISVGYTDVTSPISGRIGKSSVTEGAYVQSSAATLLATVQQLDPVYVDLTQSSLVGLKLRRDAQEGRLKTSGPNAAKVTLILEDGRPYNGTGKLEFSDVTVDQTTGSVTVRALFDNAQRVLLPGMYVRAKIEEGINEQAYVVPQQGVTHDQKGDPTALVVGADGKVVTRQLVTSGTYGANWVVESGLQTGDRVIVQGVDKVRPGMTVKTVDAQLPDTDAAAQTAAAAPASDAHSAQ